MFLYSLTVTHCLHFRCLGVCNVRGAVGLLNKQVYVVEHKKLVVDHLSARGIALS